ncbi:DUF2267 domain-containing protein [Bradyrhizobium neotropicale]|uniref:DUF2267 domain-containing protein n=1 Tax=Bradyrhizobium neotropicale TaxID=1497615 RepID=UPI001AD6C095|nr:DUF2267 domain-containing protein [Bradyrhizobium neotropicale]MBO4223083.1 DUF2267 domain-containing protein [Bradyrhizobium neotropicale]
MSATGLEVFDRTIHLTNSWLDEIMETLPRDRQLAWHALGAVLRTIRDRVPIELAAHLGAQLPLIVRGTYYDRFRPSDAPQNWRSAEQFLSIVTAELSSTRPVSAPDAAHAVFQVLNHYVDPGQVEKIRHALPEEVRAMWPESKRTPRRAEPVS